MTTNTPICCRLVFQEFNDALIRSFIQLCEKFNYKDLQNLTFKDPITLESGVQCSETECQFSFQLNVDENGRQLNKDERYKQICIAFSELTFQFELRRKNFVDTRGLSQTATVKMAISSQDIYPRHFQLQNVFCMESFGLGSIVRKRGFAPSFVFKEPENDRGQHDIFSSYLDEQRDMIEVDSNMLLFFEHDRNMFTICFPDILRNTHAREGRSNNRVVDFRVSYSSIQRIIVTPKYDRQSGEYEVTFTIQLSCPPTIQISEQQPMHGKSNGPRNKFKHFNRFLTFNHSLDVENCVASASCLIAKCRRVDARSLLNCFGRIRQSINSGVEFRFLEWRKRFQLKDYKSRDFLMHAENLPSEFEMLKEPKYFPLVYAIQALISRGGEIYEYFFRPDQGFGCFDNFLKSMIENFDADSRKTIMALENMLTEIDKCIDIPEPEMLFNRMIENPPYQTASSVTDDQNLEGYMRVRKVVITPTRKLLLSPELIMGNRFLRKHGSEKVIRILFRDSDGSKLSFMNSRNVSFNCVKNVLQHGITVAGNNYVFIGSSCSQLRDNGCYFVQGDVEDAKYLRSTMGRFKLEPVPKMMARIGQCFTQSKLTHVPLDRKKYAVIQDFEGGWDSKGKSYCFSDGVGVISAGFASRISTDLHFNGAVPSCYQFRFRGFKGVLSVSPELDRIIKWYTDNNIVSEKPQLEMQLRLSQQKFKGPREDFVEIVKHSAPSAVSLNKPMINIMDQVSSKQSPGTHSTIRKRITYLLNRHINRIMGSLNNEKDAFLSFSEFPKLILTERMYDFCLTQEPFFRSLLRAWAKFMLNKLTKKMRISIPPSLGRSMFGIVDETGLLQSGQVFIRYTMNSYEKLSQSSSYKQTHVGKVLITKNPAVVGGDIRVFEAVDCVPLRHLTDVVVFPRYGPRPHPDEMAGSDLDGDEYTVIWDPDLLLDHNEPAFDYSDDDNKDAMKSVEDEDELQDKMIQFYIDYISQDSIGILANAHLANSDLFGIASQHCNNIARKHNQAVDFPKTGIAPPPLRKVWDENMPPERVDRWPDFMGKRQRLCYRSRNLMGELYRAVEDIETALNIAEAASDVEPDLVLDEAFIIHEDTIDPATLDSHKQFVSVQYSRYCSELQNILETYGIVSEGELFSGHFSKVKGKITDSGGDNDDLSLFNTTGIVSHRLEELFVSFRTQFFDFFPGGRNYLETAEKVRINFNYVAILGQVCSRPTKQMTDLAYLYYNWAYKNKSPRFLSFAWLVWDVLAFIKRQYILQHNIKLPIDPLGTSLTNHINEVNCSTDPGTAQANHETMEMFTSLQKEWDPIRHYCETHKKLADIFLFLGLWVKQHELNVDLMKFYALVICISNGSIHPDIDDYIPWLEPYGSECRVDLGGRLGGIGRLLIILFSALSSNKLQNSSEIAIQIGEHKYDLSKNDFVSIRDAALTSYYHLSLTNTRFVLPQPILAESKSAFSPVIEGPPCIIELPGSEFEKSISALRQRAKAFGCSHLAYRVISKFRNQDFRVFLIAKGNLQQIRSFYDSIAVEPNDYSDAKALVYNMTHQVYEKIFTPV